jgi:hypothetical protein
MRSLFLGQRPRRGAPTSAFFTAPIQGSDAHSIPEQLAFMASMAVDNGLNPNLLRRCVLEYEWLGLRTLDAVRTGDAPYSF